MCYDRIEEMLIEFEQNQDIESLGELIKAIVHEPDGEDYNDGEILDIICDIAESVSGWDKSVRDILHSYGMIDGSEK